MADPRLKPMNIRVMRKLRWRLGMYSDNSVVLLGIAAPNPRPVRKRSTASSTGERANAQSTLNMAKHATDHSSTRRRPRRSE
ncbi:hypothetical protein D3C87_1656300 [compost metagenome]